MKLRKSHFLLVRVQSYSHRVAPTTVCAANLARYVMQGSVQHANRHCHTTLKLGTYFVNGVQCSMSETSRKGFMALV